MSSLGRYPSEVHGLAREILDEFSEEEIEKLFLYLSNLGYASWFRWKQENKSLITEYISATLSKRKKLKKYKTEMPQLAYAAYQLNLAGYYFLKSIESNLLFKDMGMGYRDMAASAANAFYEIDDEYEFHEWPQRWGKDPFE